jgi:glyoxalase family protein
MIRLSKRGIQTINEDQMNLNGIHHVTAVSAKIAQNLGFYQDILGLRLVKKSVNQDDVSAYHLFYADKLGTPGTDMTFFDWPKIGQNVPGTDSIAGTAFRVSSREALEFWAGRFDRLGIRRSDITTFAGRELLPFQDPEGQQLYLVNDRESEFEGEIWPQPGIQDQFLIKGFYSVILSVPAAVPFSELFSRTLHFEEIVRDIWIDGKSGGIIFSARPEGGPGGEIWLLEQPDLPRAQLGAGGTHHVAFRVADQQAQQHWHVYLGKLGLPVSPVIDRFWFSSIYFRVSPGILFEIATDGPGFAIDEDPEELGRDLILPPFLEGRRQQIEAGLIPLPG